MLPKLITGLNTLSKENWRQFTKYLLMYVREQSAPHKLLVLLDKNQQRLPSFDSAKWHQKYMPDISEKAWLNNLSRLYSYLEEYIVHQNLRSDKIRSGIELVKHWNRIGEYKLADSKAKQVQTLLDSSIGYSPSAYHDQYLLYYYQFFSDNPVKDKDTQLIYKLIDSYLTYCRYGTSLHRMQLSFWQSIRHVDTEVYLSYLSQLQDVSTEPIITQLLRLIENTDVEAYYHCRAAIYDEEVNVTDDFYVLINMYLLSYAQKLWHLQLLRNPEDLIGQYELALEKGVLMKSGRIPDVRFITIANILASFYPAHRTLQFVARWSDKVQTEDPDGIKSLVNANVHFRHGNFSEAASTLQSISTKLVNVRAQIHQLSIKLYYETIDENYNLLVSSIDRYQAYLRRREKKLSPSNYLKSKNFIKNVQVLLRSDDLPPSFPQYRPSRETKWLLSKKT